MNDKVFLNNTIVDSAEADISTNDAGFLYGMGLFETMRAHNGRIFAIEDHLDRLFFSIDSLKIPNTYSREHIREAISKTIEANNLTEARVRLTLTSGPVDRLENPQPTLLVTATEFSPYPQQCYENGITVTLCQYRQNATDPLCRHKTTNYFLKLTALQQARQAGAAESLWFTTESKLAEGCISNVFLVKAGKLLTPPLTTPVLAGIAREQVCQMAIKDPIELIERDLFISDLLEAEEVFITNVLMKVMPVTMIEKHSVGDGKPGKLTGQIARMFDDRMEQLTVNSDQ